MEPLPPKVHKKGPSYYYVHNNTWFKLSRDRDRAIEMVSKGLVTTLRQHPATGQTAAEYLGGSLVIKDLKGTFTRCQTNAKKRGIPFEIDFDLVIELAERQMYCCAVSGLRFNTRFVPNKRRPFTPSIDRIDSNGGYTPDNVRLVCWAVNAAMQDWGYDTFLLIADAVVSHQSRVKKPSKNLLES